MNVDLSDPQQVRLLSAAVTANRIKSLAGYSICLTGTMSMPRMHMKALITALGGRNTSTVDRSTNLLVAANPMSNTEKTRTAREMGIEIYSEKEFTDLIAVEK